ncbi:MAG TPA: hypothetical protein VLL52_15370 [Anaerolineae bacterium]|nr:hypothetical protein [Anaerolineae bacterium]
MLPHLSPKHILRDGLTLSFKLTTLILTSLYYNADMWRHDYHPAIQEQLPPLPAKSKKQANFTATIFMTIIMRHLIHTNRALHQRANGRVSFTTAFLHNYFVLTIFNAIDAFILDYFLFKFKPKWLILPGTEGHPAYDDYGFHLKASAKGLLLTILPSTIAAYLTSRHHPQN